MSPSRDICVGGRREARAALMALHLSGVVFRRRWKAPRLKPWEGPFADPTRRLPRAPNVAARRRWLARQRAATAHHDGTQMPDGPALAAARKTAS
jgi:hypothetical protein